MFMRSTQEHISFSAAGVFYINRASITLVSHNSLNIYCICFLCYTGFMWTNHCVGIFSPVHQLATTTNEIFIMT